MTVRKAKAWLSELEELIAAGREEEFYSWGQWRRLRKDVIEKLDNNECQICKAKGRFRRGNILHHVKHLQDRPDLALSVWDPDTGERQLITVCKDCHEAQHPESLRQFRPAKPPVTVERWD